MSETCAIGTNNPVISTTFSGNIGLPLPGIDIAIKDDEGNSLPQGESGEICIRGPNVMVGYYNQPEENAKAFTPDGFMRTGDIGIMDPQGYTRIIDRKKDMILVSGFNVFPNELEQVISLCPGVVECAAIGVPDEKQGEAIKVFIIKNDPALTEDEVANYCHQNLTGYKRPKYIEFRDELPKSNVARFCAGSCARLDAVLRAARQTQPLPPPPGRFGALFLGCKPWTPSSGTRCSHVRIFGFLLISKRLRKRLLSISSSSRQGTGASAVTPFEEVC